MSVNLSQLAIDTALTATAEDIVVAPAGAEVFIGSPVFTNSGASAEVVTVWRLGSATADTATNYIAKRTILPQKTWIPRELIGAVVADGATIKASGTSTNVQVNISGTITTNS